MNDSSTALPDPDVNWAHRLPPNDPALSDLLLPAWQDQRWYLQRDAQAVLELIDSTRPSQRGLRIELGSSDMQRRIAGGRQQPLAKACGLSKGGTPRIHDLTAGLCRDAWCLASLGAELTAWERHPVLFALMRDALAQARTPTSARIQARHRDGRGVAGLNADVVYLDPMFPSSGKRAAPGLEMQILQQLVGADEDAGELLDAAMHSGARRVVLKRPPRGARVTLGKPDLSFGGGRAVYDVYLRP